MDLIQILEAISAAMVPLAALFLMIPKRFGFWVFNIANVIAAIVFIDKHLWFYLGQVIFLCVLNFISLSRWKKRNIG